MAWAGVSFLRSDYVAIVEHMDHNIGRLVDLFPASATECEETVTIASHTFTIPQGYELKRVAAPSLVKRPIHMCFDVEGVLYVTDSSGNTQ